MRKYLHLSLRCSLRLVAPGLGIIQEAFISLGALCWGTGEVLTEAQASALKKKQDDDVDHAGHGLDPCPDRFVAPNTAVTQRPKVSVSAYIRLSCKSSIRSHPAQDLQVN